MSLLRKRLLDQYEDIYKKLNPEQQLAVDTIEGPVVVIAGPGTGKTQILGARIGKILLETDALPSNILCLTYTEAGVVAMRKRLLKFIGADAYQVHLHTFHSFCNDIIQQNATLFNRRSLEAISDLQRTELLKQMIDELPKAHPLKRYKEDYFDIKRLASLFATLKKEFWSADYLHERINDYLQVLPENEGMRYKRPSGKHKVGDFKKAYYDEVTRMEKLHAAVALSERYRELMQERGLYDFEDMINWVITQFDNNPDLLAQYQEQFQYILVDEYQDTSGTQNRLVEQLISDQENPNIFVVGDDDQSIFRFQGANVENMMSFIRQRSEDRLLRIVLQSNYRSTQPILDASRALISNNEERLIKRLPDLTKELRASHPERQQHTHRPEVWEFQTARHELAYITLQIEKLIKEKNISPGRIAVIYPKHRIGDELSVFLRTRGIAYYSRRETNLLQEPLITQLLQIMQYVYQETQSPGSGDHTLFELLHYPYMNIPAMDVARLMIQTHDIRVRENKQYTLREHINTYVNTPAKDLFSPSANENLVRVAALLETWIKDAFSFPFQHFFEKIIRESGVLRYIMSHDEKIWYLKQLTGFFNFIKDETHRQPDMHLAELFQVLDLMNENGIALSMQRIEGSDSGVNLVTAHGSKGLEFEYVFISHCTTDEWEKKKGSSNQEFKLPPNVFTSEAKGSNEEEARRLFYVAMTRAEVNLYMSYSLLRENGKEREPTAFLQEIRDEFDIPVIPRSLTDEELLTFEIQQFEAELRPEIEQLEADFVQPLIDRFVMNVTALNSYLRCPLQFYFQNLVRVPQARNENTAFGSAMHYALETFYKERKLLPDPKGLPSEEFLLHAYEQHLFRLRESFTRESFQRKLEYGQDLLRLWHGRHSIQEQPASTIEMNIQTAIQGIPVKGKLDRVDYLGGKQVIVVDYKTGKSDEAHRKITPPSAKEPLGTDYWRQAVFYKLLMDHRPQQLETQEIRFEFLEPTQEKEFPVVAYHPTPQDFQTVKQQMQEAWQRIQAHDFYTGCGKSDCEWCQFAKTHELAIHLHAPETDEPEEE